MAKYRLTVEYEFNESADKNTRLSAFCETLSERCSGYESECPFEGVSRCPLLDVKSPNLACRDTTPGMWLRLFDKIKVREEP